jgi:hypothetical protein
VTSSEFAFLAIGLVLGLASGAALIEFIRARPPVPREVRVTVAPDAVPRRRPATLADDAFAVARPEPARGGPADRRSSDAAIPAGIPDRRTAVRFGGPMLATVGAFGGGVAVGPGRVDSGAGGASHGDIGRTTSSPTRAPERDDRPDATSDPALRLGVPLALTAVAVLERPVAAAEGRADADADRVASLSAGSGGSTGGTGTTPSAGTAPVDTERCAEERRLAEERCELATRARAQANAAVEALRAAQRSYDEHEAAASAADGRADARAVHAAKEAAQAGFRNAVAVATTSDALEAAARDWLTEINRINNEAREARTRADREHAAARTIGGSLERLSLEADAARIGSENAEAACLAARVAVAECDERPNATPGDFPNPPGHDDGLPRLDDDETLGIALESGGTPRIFRMVRGDREAMTSLVAILASDDPEERRHWQLLMASLVEAIIADAIEASALEFPDDDPFWGTFDRLQRRDIAHALASLGYRFDGLGGWTDDRHPSQRDLSLALGYAGMDPMRMRRWPTEAETGTLYAKATVAADEYLAGVAGDLTLAEMVTMLGRRADGLAEVWNAWGRIRPLLFEEA